MATAKKHAERSKVTRKNDNLGRDYFFRKCVFYADLRSKAKDKRKGLDI